MTKGLIVNIYKTPLTAGCSNNGVSQFNDSAILIGPGIPEIFEAKENTLVLRLERGNLPGTVKIVPVNQPPRSCGPMFGGAFVYTSDSRFSSAVDKLCGSQQSGAVPLHDRFETSEEYARYSA